MKDGSVPWAAGVHPGIDLVSDSNPAVYALRSGRVISSNDGGAWGKHITVKHDDGLYCIYAHLADRLYETTDWIEEGAVIGIMGATGNVTGKHLHLEIQTNYYNANAHADIAEYLGIANVVGTVKHLP